MQHARITALLASACTIAPATDTFADEDPVKVIILAETVKVSRL